MYHFIEMMKRTDKFLSTLCLNLEKRFVLEKAKTEIKYKK